MTNGSGVNLEKFPYVRSNIVESKIKFLMIARLLRDKGIHEYLVAAKTIKTHYPSTEFILAGPMDKSPNSFDRRSLKNYEDDGTVKYLGPIKDVRDIIANTDVFVLPSYHEGTPRTVLEAMAMGRPIITTDTPGCKETVLNGVNGWLVPVRNISALTEKMEWFIRNPHLIARMGKAARLLAEDRYDVNQINSEIIRIIKNTHTK